jgi:hypothetical protein
MKKNIFLLLLISCSLISFGQFNAITPKAGLTLSKARNFISEKEYYKPGFIIGVEADYRLSSKLILQPELVFEQKGTLQKEEGVDINGYPTGTVKGYYTWNYIGIPVLLKYKPFEKNQIYFLGGGYADFLVSEIYRLAYTENGVVHDQKDKTEISGYGRWDVGFQAGGGIDIPIGKRNAIQIDGRYIFGINLGGATMPPATGTFSLSAGYVFNLVK